MVKTKTVKRKFLGKTEDFNSREEKIFHQRMLGAYLKGHKRFNFWGEEYIVLQSNS